MTAEQVKGVVREVLMAVGAVVAAFDFWEGTQWDAVAGFTLAAAMVTWAVLAKQTGGETLRSLVRKLLTAAVPLLVEFQLMPAEKATAVVGAIVALTMAIWSAKDNGPPRPPTGRLPVVLALLCLAMGSALLWTGCTVRVDPATQEPVLGTDAAAAGAVADAILDRLFEAAPVEAQK